MTFVLRHRDAGHRPLYMYKSVRPDTRNGVGRNGLRYMVTDDLSRARTWKTREGAEGYAARPTFGGKFAVVEVP
jgi:hypothetical protein